MLNLGFTELMVILVLAIVVVGPDRLPEMVRFLGRQYGKLMRTSDELRRAFVLEADRAEAEKRADALRARREEARKRAEEARARRKLEGPSSEVEPVARPDGDEPAEDDAADDAAQDEPPRDAAPPPPPAPVDQPPDEAALRALDDAFPRLDAPRARGDR